MNFSLAIQIVSFLVSHKEDIKTLVASLESLAADLPGSQKAQAVKAFVGGAMNIEAQIESAWPLVAPIFNAFVAVVKKPA